MCIVGALENQHWAVFKMKKNVQITCTWNAFRKTVVILSGASRSNLEKWLQYGCYQTSLAVQRWGALWWRSQLGFGLRRSRWRLRSRDVCKLDRRGKGHYEALSRSTFWADQALVQAAAVSIQLERKFLAIHGVDRMTKSLGFDRRVSNEKMFCGKGTAGNALWFYASLA